MTDYTPTTEEVRQSWIGRMTNAVHSILAGAEFDRWLAEVKAEAWEEGAQTTYQDNNIVGGIISRNPYRQETK